MIATQLIVEQRGIERTIILRKPRTIAEVWGLFRKLGYLTPTVTLAEGSSICRVSL